MSQVKLNDVELDSDLGDSPKHQQHDKNEHKAQEGEDQKVEQESEDERTWMASAYRLGENVLYVADFLGEVFAEFFGMTQSRYQWAIDAYERQQRWEREDREKEQYHKRIVLQDMKKRKSLRKQDAPRDVDADPLAT